MASAAPMPSVSDARPPTPSEARLLLGLVRSGDRIVAATAGPPAADDPMEGASRVLFRRWFLDLLLILRLRGPTGFNELSRQLGSLAGESLAPKLREAEREGLVTRHDLGGRPRRVLYTLTPAGERLSAGVYALTSAKAEHARILDDPDAGLALPLQFDARRVELRAELAGFLTRADEFAAAQLGRGATVPLDDRLRIARRFSRTCVRKWHGSVLATLAAAGPLRFADLKAATRAGDQALSAALAELERIESVGREPGGAWAIRPLGRMDLALGAPLLLALPRLQALHAV